MKKILNKEIFVKTVELICVIGLMFLLFEFMDQLYKDATKIDHYERQEIFSLRNDEHVSGGGTFFVTVDTNEYVHYWIKQGDEFIPNKVPMEKCRFFETIKENEVPYVEIGINKKSKLKSDYKFYIPKGTIGRSYNLD